MSVSSVRFTCPGCREDNAVALEVPTKEIHCEHCNIRLNVTLDAVVESRLVRCLVCPSTELFVRKNFPQRLGVGIVVVGFAISCWTWYHHMVVATFAVLMATALIDVVLYALVGEVLECYRCHAQYSGIAGSDEHEGFNLEIHEKHRQQLARLSATAAQVKNSS